jgi:hypothetical protein
MITVKDGLCDEARIVLGAVAPTPLGSLGKTKVSATAIPGTTRNATTPHNAKNNIIDFFISICLLASLVL